MKHSITILLCFFSVLSCTEIGDTYYHITRTIRNESGREIKIISYFKESFSSEYGIDTVIIDLIDGADHSVYGDFTSIRAKAPLSSAPIESIHSADSVVVVFDSTKYEVHCNIFFMPTPANCTSSIEENIIISSPSSIHGGANVPPEELGYHVENANFNVGEWVYIFTDKHYKNAEDCAGTHYCE